MFRAILPKSTLSAGLAPSMQGCAVGMSLQVHCRDHSSSFPVLVVVSLDPKCTKK